MNCKFTSKPKTILNITYLIVISLMITFIPIGSVFSATKPGSKCSKLSSKSIIGNKTYTCIKLGKKLIWNKGVQTPAPKKLLHPFKMTYL